jgi:thioester reductase-like protein
VYASRSLYTKFNVVIYSGAAGIFGTALLYRLVELSLRIKRVFALIRKERGSSQLPEELSPHIANVDENGDLGENGLVVVLPGDCSVPGFGLSEKETKWLREVDIVIHGAGIITFTMSLPKAVKAIVSDNSKLNSAFFTFLFQVRYRV